MSLYETLGVDSGCSSSELRRQYHRLLLEYHPDKTTDSVDPTKKTRYDDIQHAYKILSNVETRRRYDQEQERKHLHSLAHNNVDLSEVEDEYFCRCGTCLVIEKSSPSITVECPNCSTKIEISNKSTD